MSRKQWVLILLTCAFSVSIFMISNLKSISSAGLSLEEAAGLVNVPLDWRLTNGRQEKQEEKRGLISSPMLPVWGYSGRDGLYEPIMIDGHMGAISFYPSRLALKIQGISAAKTLHVCLGVVAILCTLLMAMRLFGYWAGLLAMLFVSTMPGMHFLHSLVRPDEQWSFLCPLIGSLALLRYSKKQDTYWLCFSAFLFGLGVAAKNTAVWTFISGAVALWAFGARQKNFKQLFGCGLCFVLPLLPQIAYMFFSESTGALWSRFALVAKPWELLSFERLSFFVMHFMHSISGLGSSMAFYLSGKQEPLPAVTVVSGIILLTVISLGPIILLLKEKSRNGRIFAAALILLEFQYILFYYIGDSFFFLTFPWLAILFSGITVFGWRVASAIRLAWKSRLFKAMILLGWAVIFANQVLQLKEFKMVLVRHSDLAVQMGMEAQKELVEKLEEFKIDRPWTVTYMIGGVLELLSEGRIKARNAYLVVKEDCGADKNPEKAYTAVWKRIFSLMGGGKNYFVITPRPNRVEMSPCLNAEWMWKVLPEVLKLEGGSMQEIFTIRRENVDAFKVVEVNFNSR